MFWSMILHIYCKKNRPKNEHSFLRSEENYRRMNNLNAFYTDFFVWITACHGPVHEKWPKDTEETWIPTEEQREQAKSGFKTVFWALIGTNRDESAFWGHRAGRRVSVSKSGLSRRKRDGWQVCMKNNGKSPTFKFVSGEENRPSEVQRVSRGWRLPGATHSSADLTWIRKWLEIQAPERSQLESVDLELGCCCSDFDKQVSDEICRARKRQFEIPFRL